MMNVQVKKEFLKACQKDMPTSKKKLNAMMLKIIEDPVEFGEPLKGNFIGFYSCPIKLNFIIIYLYYGICRKNGDDEHVACAGCSETADETNQIAMMFDYVLCRGEMNSPALIYCASFATCCILSVIPYPLPKRIFASLGYSPFLPVSFSAPLKP